MTALIHIAAPHIRVNDRLRQRCGWCGTTLIDEDLTRVMVPEGSGPLPTWPAGELVHVDGGASWIQDHVDGDPLPDNSCGLLDPDVTA